ncbi:hypothetical protein FACS189460_5450 [Deltaproteobacteria bacterium]|nr:hypothetical protein FACS189460_5450 [Deltaproteobacteria bacterium]
MPWWVEFNALRPQQRAIVDLIRNNPNQHHWIKGFAGTGKTLILLQVIEQIAATNPNASLCYITYTNALVALAGTIQNRPAFVNRLDIKTYHMFLHDHRHYDFVFLDEVQDVETGRLARIKALSRHLYVAGDPDQQIYQGRVTPAEITETLQPLYPPHELREVCRLTPKLCQVARSINPDTQLIAGLTAYPNPNASITLMQADFVNEEANWVWQEARNRARPGAPAVIL